MSLAVCDVYHKCVITFMDTEIFAIVNETVDKGVRFCIFINLYKNVYGAK